MFWSCVSGAFGAVMLGGVVVPAMTIFVFSCRSGPTSFFGDAFRGGARAYAPTGGRPRYWVEGYSVPLPGGRDMAAARAPNPSL